MEPSTQKRSWEGCGQGFCTGPVGILSERDAADKRGP
jgi:hypothetical protein